LRGEHAFAAADVEHRAGSRLGEELIEVRWKPAIRRRNHRIGGAVLIEVFPVGTPVAVVIPSALAV